MTAAEPLDDRVHPAGCTSHIPGHKCDCSLAAEPRCICSAARRDGAFTNSGHRPDCPQYVPFETSPITMTAESIDERVALAKGWERRTSASAVWQLPDGSRTPTCWYLEGQPIAYTAPAYSTDPALWGPMMEELIKSPDGLPAWLLEIGWYSNNGGDCRIRMSMPGKYHKAVAPTLGAAVCEAWLATQEAKA